MAAENSTYNLQVVAEWKDIKEITPLRFCSSDTINNIIIPTLTARDYSKGDIITQDSTNLSFVHIIQKGRLYKIADSGEKQVYLDLIDRGRIIGYETLFKNNLPGYRIQAMDDVTAFLLPVKDFEFLLKHEERFAFEMFKSACHELTKMNYHMVFMCSQPVRSRVAYALLYMIRLNDDSGDGMISSTRTDIANFSCMRRESASKTISEFRKQGLIEVEKNIIKVKNLSELRKIRDMYI